MPSIKKKKLKEKSGENPEDEKLWAFLVTFLSIVGYVLILIRERKSEYVNFYARQSLVVFIVAVIAGLMGWLVMWIPILGMIIKVGLGIIVLVLWVLSWMNALSGEKKEVPLFGHYGRRM